MMRPLRRLRIGVLFALVAAAFAAPSLRADEIAAEVYETPEQFLARAFGGNVPEAAVLWFDEARKKRVRAVIGHDYGALRVKYWRVGERTAWILEEIGKFQPITAGFVVEEGVIREFSVLVYRESHGWEIRYPFFTDQFDGLALNPEGELSDSIDNIAGATLSVNAMRSLARLALYLHGEAVHGPS